MKHYCRTWHCIGRTDWILGAAASSFALPNAEIDHEHLLKERLRYSLKATESHGDAVNSRDLSNDYGSRRWMVRGSDPGARDQLRDPAAT